MGPHIVKRAPEPEPKGLSSLSVCPLAVPMPPYLSFPIRIQLIFTRYVLCARLPVDALNLTERYSYSYFTNEGAGKLSVKKKIKSEDAGIQRGEVTGPRAHS